MQNQQSKGAGSLCTLNLLLKGSERIISIYYLIDRDNNKSDQVKIKVIDLPETLDSQSFIRCE